MDLRYDPDVEAYLAGPTTGPAAVADLPKRRREYDEAAAELFGPAPDVPADDLDAAGVPVRVYRPTGNERGGLVWHHGGGWVIGSVRSHDGVFRTLAARSGAAVVAVDYRLAPEHPYPAAVDDAWTAYSWAAQRFERLAIGGDSAGGALTAAVARRARDAGPDAPAQPVLQVLVYPALDHGRDYESYQTYRVGPWFSTVDDDWYWGQYVNDPAQLAQPDCCPARATDLKGLAPTLMLTAEHDPLRDEGEAYAAALSDAGVAVTTHRFDGLIHGFLRMPAVIGRADGALTEIAQAVRDALAAG